MFRRAKNFLADVLQQADMILLALCCAATLFGITMVYSATRYMQTNRLVIIQGCALVLGVVLYLLVSMVDLSEVVKKWKWLTMFNFGFILLLLVLAMAWTERELGIPLGEQLAALLGKEPV